MKVIQLYFTDPEHAPAWADVVGDAEINQKANGAKYARRVIGAEGFWVAMYQNQTRTVTTVTVSQL